MQGADRKVAILSNINMNALIRMAKDAEGITVYEPEGYGNELGLLLNPGSSFHTFGAETVFFWMDLAELIGHTTVPGQAKRQIDEWFDTVENGLETGTAYFISDAALWGADMEIGLSFPVKQQIEELWNSRLKELSEKKENVYVLPYHALIEKMGAENAFSETMWYLGGIAHTQAAQQRMMEMMQEKLRLLYRVPKKVLVLDLDNTLWGGLAGEHDRQPVVLSEDHKGLAYKNVQRVIRQMKDNGVMLGIVSKNNEEDAMEIIEKHPHMILRAEDFVNKKINWDVKAENLKKMAAELNLGLDSFVFFDDSDTEREQICQMLPEVEVPEFPKKPEKLASAMVEIYQSYFEKLKLTEEDRHKTAMYAADAKRQELQHGAMDYAVYLGELGMLIIEQEPADNRERLLQLVNKTNQFNLTTKRYEPVQIADVLADEGKITHLYRVSDKFGDNGIVAAVIVDISGKVPVLEEFTMSCRVMGRQIEDYIIDRVEQEVEGMGYRELETLYIPTQKNKPVENLYDRLGYRLIADEAGTKRYRIVLADKPERVYYVQRKE